MAKTLAVLSTDMGLFSASIYCVSLYHKLHRIGYPLLPYVDTGMLVIHACMQMQIPSTELLYDTSLLLQPCSVRIKFKRVNLRYKVFLLTSVEK